MIIVNSVFFHTLRVCSFDLICIRISDPRSLVSWCIKGTDESTLVTDSSAPLMHHDPSDIGLLILIQIIPKERTLVPRAIRYQASHDQRYPHAYDILDA